MTDRQRRLRGWDQDRISRTRVLIAGAGALGNELLKNLLMLGVGKVFIADHDRVEVSNLNRCIFFTIDDAFKQRLKVEALAEKVKAINPAVEVVPIASRVEEMRKEVFDEVDLALGALDSLEARLQLNIECCVRGKPLIDGGIEGLSGQVQVVIPKHTACIECGLAERDRELLRQRISCGGGLRNLRGK